MLEIKENKILFTKPSLSLKAQLDLLIARGLIIDNPAKAILWLKYIGYYRLSGYTVTFQIDNKNIRHQFKNGVYFEDIINLYNFDRDLRILIMDALERIEVAVRTVISNTLSDLKGPHWYLKQELFDNSRTHERFLQKLDQILTDSKKEIFIDHYLKKYTPKFPPSWMLAESISFGTWSTLFAHLKERKIKNKISAEFSLHHLDLKSWLHSLAYTRNLCAHHLRLWNRKFTICPRLTEGYENHLRNKTSLYAQIVMIHALIRVIGNSYNWQCQLIELINSQPQYTDQMGFPKNWQKDKLWSTQFMSISKANTKAKPLANSSG